MTRSDLEDARVAREVAERAIRRLDLLEWVILSGAAALAVVGGFLVALVISPSNGWPLRLTWLAASLLLFGVPGIVVLIRSRRQERAERGAHPTSNEETHG